MKAWTIELRRSHCRLYASRAALSGKVQPRAQQDHGPAVTTHHPLERHHATTRSLSADAGSRHRLTNTLQPLPADLKNVEAWVALIEPYLPRNIRAPHVSPVKDRQPLAMIARIIAHARQTVNIDVVASLGIDQKRWNAVHWICTGLVDQAGPPNQTSSTQIELLSDIPLLVNGSNPARSADLERITQRDSELMLDLSSHADKSIVSIDETINDLMAPAASKSQAKANAILGEIWITLGNLILAATSDKSQPNTKIMPNVLRIIANLHHHGWIPEAVYHDSDNSDPSALQQPPLLSELSSIMISALTEAAYTTEAGADATSSESFLKSRIFSRTPDKIPNLGPEIWLEFCLWCCVHGGWVHQGSAILDEMRKLQGQQKWSLIYWRDILESPEKKWEEFTKKRLKSGYGENVKAPSKRDLVQRTISAEVVVAVIDGLVSDMLLPDLPVNAGAVARLIRLKTILDTDKMGLGVSSWDAVIARIADASTIDVKTRPTAMELTLSLTETYGQEIHALNAPKSGEGTDPVASYVFDASAATIGIYHQTLHAYIKGRDVSKALRILGKLQSLTDVNKMRSLEEFFRELQETPVKAADEPVEALPKQEFARLVFSFQQNMYPKFPGVQYPGYFPAIPVPILADLLDLLVESGNREVARWMLYSQDIDGPLIPESTYGDQLMAPALIRFAAAWPDQALLLKVTEVQSTAISGPTLIALCQSRMRQRNFIGAVEILDLIREYSLHEWKPEDFAPLLQILLQMTHEHSASSSRESVQLMQQMLRAKFGKLWGDRPSQLDTIVGVLSDFSPDVRQICAGLLQSANYYRMDMTTKTFNILLDGAIRTFGVDLGQRLVQDWCLDVSNMREIAIVEDSQSLPLTRVGPAEKFFGAEQQRYEAGTAVFEGIIQHDVETIRTVIAGVLRENTTGNSTSATSTSEDTALPDQQPSDDNLPSVNLSTAVEIEIGIDATPIDDNDARVSFDRQHPIMEWAINILRQDFNMPATDIDYLTQGYLTSQHHDTTLQDQQIYSPETLRMWRTLQPTHKVWAKTQESRLRRFAISPVNVQFVIAHVPGVERHFLRCLVGDLGLELVEFGGEEDGDERDVRIVKRERVVKIPSRTIWGLLRLQARRSG